MTSEFISGLFPLANHSPVSASACHNSHLSLNENVQPPTILEQVMWLHLCCKCTKMNKTVTIKVNIVMSLSYITTGVELLKHKKTIIFTIFLDLKILLTFWFMLNKLLLFNCSAIGKCKPTSSFYFSLQSLLFFVFFSLFLLLLFSFGLLSLGPILSILYSFPHFFSSNLLLFCLFLL